MSEIAPEETAGSVGSLEPAWPGVAVGGSRPTEPEREAEVVEYHFPVEIEVRSEPAAIDPDEIAKQALQSLSSALKGT